MGNKILLGVGAVALGMFMLCCGGMLLLSTGSGPRTAGIAKPAPQASKVPAPQALPPGPAPQVADAPKTEIELAEAKLAEAEKQLGTCMEAKPILPPNEDHLFVDATGAFKVNAKVVALTATDISLSKTDGSGTATVPVKRLSEYDQKYVTENFGDYLGKVATWDAERLRLEDQRKEAADNLAALNARVALAAAEALASEAKKTKAAADAQATAAAEKAEEAAKPQKELAANVAEFKQVLQTLDYPFVTGMRGTYVEPKSKFLTLTVSNVWHELPRQVRLQHAQSLQKVWSTIASRNDPLGAYIEIVDNNGNRVGGGGTYSVSVDD